MSTIDPQRPDIAAFIAEASRTLGKDLPTPKDVFAFGDSEAKLNDSLLALVLAGKKTGTATYPIPDPLHWGPGDYAVVVDSESRPRAVIRTVSLVRCAFQDVTEEFALSEAEGDYQAWREGHIWFWKESQKGTGFSEDSVILCERFELVYPETSQ